MDNKYLFGAVYIIEQEYSDETIRRDLKNMKDCGFNLITLWPIANPWLAKSSHEWIFTRTRFVLDCCEELELKAILQLFGQNQAQEFLPDSVCLPEMECVDERGGISDQGSNCFWANLNHPTVREYIDKYFKEAITALKDHPAVYGWDVFNEAHFRSDDRWTKELYKEWLKEKYGTIENLNYKWYRRYESFSQIRPDKRRAPYSIWSSLLPSVEYEKFRSVNVTEICRFLYETAKKYDPEHPVMIDGTSTQIVYEDVTLRNNDEFETAYIPDIYGATFYPKSWGRNYRETPWTLSMYYSIPAAAAKIAGKPYFVNELQTHTQSVLTPGSEVTDEELTAWTLMCIFSGANAMQLWRWRPFLHGYQATGRGLTRMDGTPNHRALAMKKLAGMLHKNSDLFSCSKPASPAVSIAMTYDERLFFDSLLKFGDAGKSFWSKNVEGWYKLFWNWGLQTDFTDLAHFNGSKAEMPILVLPGAVSISEAQAKELCAYVEKGGILIADGRMGAINEWGQVPEEGIPGKTLSTLFGFTEVDVNSGESMCIGSETVPTGFQYQLIELTDDNANILACMADGSPAVIEHAFGKGKTVYFNSFEGLVLLEELYPALLDIVRKATEPVNHICAEKHSRVHLAYMDATDKKLILAVNFSDSEQKVRFEGMAPGAKLRELFSEDEFILSAEGELVLPKNSQNVFVL